MDNSFAITVAFIALVTLIAAFVRRIKRDKCLRDFRRDYVNLFRTDGKGIWGRLRLENTGLELLYPKSHKDADGHDETSYIMYKCEYSKIQAVIRFHDELTDIGRIERQRELDKTYHPKFIARTKRKIANIFKTVRDSILEVVNLLVTRMKGASGVGTTINSQEKYVNQMKQQLMNTVGTSYEPLLERYIGHKVVLETLKADKIIEYCGILKEYTADFIEVIDIDYKDERSEQTRKADVVVPRQIGLVRHAGE